MLRPSPWRATEAQREGGVEATEAGGQAGDLSGLFGKKEVR